MHIGPRRLRRRALGGFGGCGFGFGGGLGGGFIDGEGVRRFGRRGEILPGFEVGGVEENPSAIGAVGFALVGDFEAGADGGGEAFHGDFHIGGGDGGDGEGDKVAVAIHETFDASGGLAGSVRRRLQLVCQT